MRLSPERVSRPRNLPQVRAGAVVFLEKDLDPLLPLGSTTLFGQLVAQLQAAGVERVVLCGHMSELPLDTRSLNVTCLPEAQLPAEWAAGLDAILLLPVSLGLVRPQTMRNLLPLASQATPLLQPTFQGQRGHLACAAAHLAQDWRNTSGDWTSQLAQLAARFGLREVAVADANILFPCRTAEDHPEVLRRLRRLTLPTPEEAQELARLHGLSGAGLAHGQAVAGLAMALADALEGKQPAALDRDLVYAAGLLHDLAKPHQDHEAQGAALLEAAGFSRLAPVVAAHRDTQLSVHAPLTEREVVFLADKLIFCHQFVPMAVRFQDVLDRYGTDPQEAEAIGGRRDRAMALLDRFEATAGRTVADIAAQAHLAPPRHP